MSGRDKQGSGGPVSVKSGGGGGAGAGSGASRGNRNKKPQQKQQQQQPQRKKTAREVALDTLVKVAEAGAYSNLQLNRALQDAQLSRQDAGLATELVYGTIQHQRLLDERLSELVTKGFNKLTPWVLVLLRMSAYQLLMLDRIPPHAAVNEAVVIAKRRGHSGISGMINGVLRNIERSLAELKKPLDIADPVKRIGITYSYPDWLVKRWIGSYGEAVTEQICAAGNEPPHNSVRVNPLRLSRDKASAMLSEASGGEALVEPSRLSEHALIVSGAGNLAGTDGYRNGLWSLQDESSMLVAEVCAPKPGMKVLDCCAAPGGKTTHLAELMEDRGEVIANDVHPHKKQLIEEQAARLGLTSVQAVTGDATELASRFEQSSFDVVLLDAPCSGFGVIRRKPEIKWTKSAEDVRSIAALQEQLIDEAAKLVRPGGTLVYSTCTIEREENEHQVAKFLERHAEYKLDTEWPAQVLRPLQEGNALAEPFSGMVQLLPQQFGSDGFFIARLTRQL